MPPPGRFVMFFFTVTITHELLIIFLHITLPTDLIAAIFFILAFSACQLTCNNS